MKNKQITYIATIFFVFANILFANAQLNISAQTQVNTVCNGNGCNYSGPSILINEVMLSPNIHDGSIYGTGPSFNPGDNEGEWIELYNPDLCKSVDISCYFLGNNTNEPNQSLYNLGAGYAIPQGTVVPPRGFVILRGIYADPVPPNLLIQNGGNTIEIVVNDANRICLGGGYRLWFPNAGGWFAFYNNKGVPQDAISWCSLTNSYTYANPCNPLQSGCQFTGTLASYDNIPAANKTYIATTITAGLTLARIPDGGAWQINTFVNPTYGSCNSSCVPPPIITCNGTATINVTGGVAPYSYHWSDIQAQSTPVAKGLCAGNYCVTVIDAAGHSAQTCVTVKDSVLNAFAGNDQTVCAGTNVTLTATGGSTYTWDNGVSNGVSFTPIATAIYTVTVSDSNGCIATDNVKITVNPIPVPNIGNNKTVCAGNSVTLSASGGSNIIWNKGITNGVPFTPTVTATYSVTVSDSIGCSAIDSVIVQVDPYPSLNLGNDTLLCPDQTLTLNAGNPGAIYLWSTGNNDQSITVSKTGTYFVQVAYGNCTASDTIKVVKIPPINLGSDISLCYQSEALLDPGINYYHYHWSTGDTTPSIIVKDTGEYWVSVQYQQCRLGDTVIVIGGASTLYFPNAFTPDNDNLNDIFTGYGSGVTQYHLRIFTRWGEMIFESTDMNYGWDGTYKNLKCPPDLYVWMVQYHFFCSRERDMWKYGYVVLVI